MCICIYICVCMYLFQKKNVICWCALNTNVCRHTNAAYAYSSTQISARNYI